MATLPKKILRNMINEGKLKTAENLHAYLKEIFKYALQEMQEAELEQELGYSKRDRKTNKLITAEMAIQKRL